MIKDYKASIFLIILSLTQIGFATGEMNQSKDTSIDVNKLATEEQDQKGISRAGADTSNAPNSFFNLLDTRYSGNRDLTNFLMKFPIDQYYIVNVNNEENYYIDRGTKDFIKTQLINNIHWEAWILARMKNHIIPGTIILDIGAHIGTHTINLAKCLNNGVVYAFEPQPKIFRELCYNLLLNNIQNVKLFNSAVGSENGKIELSPLCGDNEGGTGCYGNSGLFADLLTIDSLNLNNVSLIKIDVEGMENKVLEGARETILRNKPIIFIEFTGYNLSQCDENSRKILIEKASKLQALGYSVHYISGHDYVAYPL